MRLNDKHLAAFANGTAPIDKEGHLFKKGEVNKSYQKRYFVLKGNLLFYFDKKGDKDPIGVVILEGCTVELSENTDAFTFELVFQGSGSRTYVLAAESQNEMEGWMKSIACAGYDYMKLMVMELQRQLDDITTDKTPLVATGANPPIPSTDQNGSEGLLVDLSVPGPESTTVKPQPARKNPFNSGEPDSFGASPFNPEHYSSSKATFAEMHKDYGAYINRKLAETMRPVVDLLS